MNIYQRLAEGGGFSLPYLVHLYNTSTNTDIYLVNDNTDLQYDGHTFAASNFTYTPSASGDSTFNVELVEHDELIDALETNTRLYFEIIGVYNGASVEPIKTFRHSECTVEWTGKGAEMKLEQDARQSMTFPALIFNTYNNRGNS